jgi:dipeptidyl-peptidase III
MEECRAESCGLYLCMDRELLSMFHIQDPKEAENIFYVNWLQMLRAGLRALEFYTPELHQWGQGKALSLYIYTS